MIYWPKYPKMSDSHVRENLPLPTTYIILSIVFPLDDLLVVRPSWDRTTCYLKNKTLHKVTIIQRRESVPIVQNGIILHQSASRSRLNVRVLDETCFAQRKQR